MKNERKMKNEINEISCELWMDTISRSLTFKKERLVIHLSLIINLESEV